MKRGKHKHCTGPFFHVSPTGMLSIGLLRLRHGSICGIVTVNTFSSLCRTPCISKSSSMYALMSLTALNKFRIAPYLKPIKLKVHLNQIVQVSRSTLFIPCFVLIHWFETWKIITEKPENYYEKTWKFHEITWSYHVIMWKWSCQSDKKL